MAATDPPLTRRLHFRRALLPSGWADDVVVEVDGGGMIASVVAGSDGEGEGRSGQEFDARLGVVVPGMANLHSHAFQRGMAGLAERRGARGRETFWSWRRVMYAFVRRLDPDQVETLALLAFSEMLETGFTAVGEFHYLHHGPGGTRYDDVGEMAARICRASDRAGIALTLLQVLYRHGDVDGREPEAGQRRFVTDLDGFARLVERARWHARDVPYARVGIAPHSLRAVSASEIGVALELTDEGPVHIHLAEQEAEVSRCLEVLGARPVRHLLDTVPVDGRWCAIHCTHMDPGEVAALAATGAVVGLCPLTEANLGDGVALVADYLGAGGRWGVGTDSHIRIDLPGELSAVEYGQRLTRRRRTVLPPPGASTGRALWDGAAAGGAQALRQPMGAIAPGMRADLVVLDESHPRLVGSPGDALLDRWIFTADASAVDEVWVGGRRVVAGGRAMARDAIEGQWPALAREVAGWTS